MAQLAQIRKALYQPVTLGAVLSLAGILCFLMAVFGAFMDSSISPGTSVIYSSGTVCVCFRGAGWLVGSGWLLQRCEAGLWPFKSTLKKARAQCDHLARITAILCLTMIALSHLLSLLVVR